MYYFCICSTNVTSLSTITRLKKIKVLREYNMYYIKFYYTTDYYTIYINSAKCYNITIYACFYTAYFVFFTVLLYFINEKISILLQL